MTFDMQKAHMIFRRYNPFVELPDELQVLFDAVGEIERLQNEIKIASTRSVHNAKQDAAFAEVQGKRIAELEAENAENRKALIGCGAAIIKQRAALTKLGETIMARGKALVEERISGEFSDWIENQCPHWDIDEEPFCVKLDGPCEYREGKCPIRNELLDRAREQLRREGKL